MAGFLTPRRRGVAATGRVGAQSGNAGAVDGVVMDLAMPLLNGVEATRQIAKAVLSAKVLILSTYNGFRPFKKYVFSSPLSFT